MPRKESALHGMLLDLFGAPELRRFVQFTYGPEITDSLPGQSASKSTLAFGVVDVLQRHGLIDTDFFERLLDARPGRRDDVERVRGLWIVEHRDWMTPPITTSNKPTPPVNKEPIGIFVSYSRRDTPFREQLESHLKLLQRQGIVDVWHDGRIAAGEAWEDVLRRELESAEIILFLVSSDFLASDFCWGVELKRAIERADSGEARVIPVLVRACQWSRSPLPRFQILPRDAKPIGRADDTDEAWLEVANAIADAATRTRTRRGG